MKSKPLKHKNTNTFKFIPFSDRVNAIDIRHAALYHIEHAYTQLPAENETHFYITLCKWHTLNLTDNFRKFRKDVADVITLPQILHKKEQVLDTLKEYILLQDPLCLQPLLEVLVSLAKDLRDDFYPHFNEFLNILISLLKTKDADVLEWTLISLAFLFKILKPCLKKDLPTVLKSIIPLLSEDHPQYINNFAAESLSFVTRDIINKNKFIQLMLHYLQGYPNAITGCGHLLFEIFRGVSGKFHNCTETFLPILLDQVKEGQQILFQVLTQTVTDCLQSISHSEFSIFWDCIMKAIENSEGIGLEYILRLSGLAIEYKNGKYLSNPTQFLLLLIKVVFQETTENTLEVCSQIGALLLLSNIALSQEHTSILVKVLLHVPYSKIFLDFVQNVIDYSQFDISIMPNFLNFVIQTNFETEAMLILAKICLKKSPLSKNGIKLFEWVKYPINLNKDLFNKFSQSLDENIENIIENPSKCISFLIIVPHVETIDVDNYVNILKGFILRLLDLLSLSNMNINEEKSKIMRILFLLANALECAIHVSNCRNISKFCEIDDILSSLLPFSSDPNYFNALQILDLFLTAYDNENGLMRPFLSLVDSYLRKNLMSPYHKVRQLTTHIYKLFENIDEFKKSNTEPLSVFTICYSIESIRPSIQEYRSQLNKLNKISFNSPQYLILNNTDYNLYILNYMFGLLYVNFKLLWEPVINLISGYANNIPIDEFWSIFHKRLEISFEDVKDNIKIKNKDDTILKIKEIDSDIINNLYTEYNVIDERPDFHNYRNLILKLMCQCIDVCEMKNRDVVNIFLKFVNDEYRNDNFNPMTIDIEKHEKMDIEHIEVKKDTFSSKMAFKTLIDVMSVLSQFKNPRAMYKENEFWQLYMELLCSKNASLQKYALNCVINYKNKSVLPYKDNLMNLVDEKKFKAEMTAFNISEDGQIRTEDRKDVIPVVLRIMYGKMKSTDKSEGQGRRSLIMRYLAGCTKTELKIFIEMALPYCKHYMSMNTKDIYEDISRNTNFKCIISPSKLLSMLNLFDVIREYFGGYMKDELLSDVFKIFFTITSIVSTVIANGDKVHVPYAKSYRNLRSLSMGIIKKIFEQFDKYPWNKEEIFVLFETLIWPSMANLHIEGVKNPTGLLKLFNCWCLNPRYYVLLITSIGVTPLEAIFKLIKKANSSVVNIILDMIEKLLTLQDEDIAIETFNKIDLPEKPDINFGSNILIPHIPDILEIMKTKLSSIKASINKRDLLILSRVTELVSSSETCDELLNLLLPILVKKICLNMAEEDMEYSVNTLINLLERSSKPHSYVRNIAILFNRANPVHVRKLLLELLRKISENSYVIINEMNSYDKKWIEQPDFDRRLDIYKKIYELVDANDIDVDLAILIANNCFYFIRTEKDISLRDSAASCLKRLLPKLLLKYKLDRIFIKDILSLISAGIKDAKNDNLKIESIAVLSEIVRESSDVDVVLADLHPLIDVDREVDFFDNICHLQMHRRVRALLKFCKTMKKANKNPAPKTLTNFILPLASVYIADEKYTDKNTLIDACIEVIVTCCRLLPWYHYEVILKHYLNKLRYTSDFRKQLTRLLVGILDAFHFDLSKATIPKSLHHNPDKDNENVDDVNEIDLDDIKLNGDLDIDEEIEIKEDGKTGLPVFEKVTIVSPSVAKRIIKSLSLVLVPQVNRTIGKLTDYETSHKVNRRKMDYERQEEDIMKIPIALALVKLLQKLPGNLLDMQLPSIIMKLCSFLKSPLKQVRIASRDIIKKVMITVGTPYMGVLLEHLNMLLTRGFQVHVLVATVHTVLDALKNEFQRGEIDVILPNILDICVKDLFGLLSEEKEVDKLHYKTPEAKPSKKTFVTLMIISQNITEKCLINLLLPFKEVLRKHSKKIVLKVQEALTNIATGLVTNKFIDAESLFVFLHGIASESIPDFALDEKQDTNETKPKPDCLIVPETPKRNREVQARHVKTFAKANSHVLIEFSLNILNAILKREQIPKGEIGSFVDPLILILKDGVNSGHIKVTTVALKCFTSLWNIRLITPTLMEVIKDVVKTIFDILHKYATFEISKQNDNYHLVRNAFKAITVAIRNVKYYTLEEHHLKTLLLYAEEDCQNDDRQSNSFALLKAILEAKLNSSELHEVMEKIARISILSESARSREEARNIFLYYLTTYPPGKKFVRHLQFFISQLNYEMQFGRESSLKFLDTIINKIQLSQLSKHGSFLMLSLGASMIDDTAPTCREAAASCIEALLRKLPALERNKLFDLVMTFFQDSMPVHFELAAQLCTRFVITEKAEFNNRLSVTLPVITEKLLLLSNDITVGRFVKLNSEQNDDNKEEEKQREKDHSLIQILHLTEKIMFHCIGYLNTKHTVELDEIAQQCQALLAYPHSWVRLEAVKILSHFLSNIDASQLDCDCKRGFIYCDTENVLRSLVLDLCAQFTVEVSKEMAEHVSAVLFQIIKLVQSLPEFKYIETDDNVSKLNIRWILNRLRKAMNIELAKSPHISTTRETILTMLTHVTGVLTDEEVKYAAPVITPPLVRELSLTDVQSSAVRQLASRVAKKIRRRIGDVEYARLVTNIQIILNRRRAERKKVVLQEKVKNPEIAMKRKLSLKEKKKKVKKMKLEMLSGKRRKPKKRKPEDIDFEDKLLD